MFRSEFLKLLIKPNENYKRISKSKQRLGWVEMKLPLDPILTGISTVELQSTVIPKLGEKLKKWQGYINGFLLC